ncbi:hypothetical protein AVEN_4831-1, partial [Araneus ventricosus]
MRAPLPRGEEAAFASREQREIGGWRAREVRVNTEAKETPLGGGGPVFCFGCSFFLFSAGVLRGMGGAAEIGSFNRPAA